MAFGHNCNWFSESKNHTTLMCDCLYFQQYFSYIVVFSSICGRNWPWNTRRKAYHKSIKKMY